MKKALTNATFITFLFCNLFASSVSAQTTLIPKESTWSYLDNGSNQGTTWKDSGFNVASWPTGQAPLGMGGITGATMNTTITKNLTTYFVKHVTLSNPTFTHLYLNSMYDDGIVIYVNGIEVSRQNMPTGTVTYNTTATTFIGGSDEGDYSSIQVSASNLIDGVNVIAVELHNSSAGSSDLSFDLEVTGVDLGDFILERQGEWSYHDSGIDLGTAWYSTAYDASNWETGDAVLGYGGITGASVATTIDYGGISTNKHPTAYFTKEVVLDNPNYSQLQIGLLADDGAAVYINGKFAFKAGLPYSWNYNTYADHTAAGADEGDYEIYEVPDTFLVNGVNVFSAEVHQTNASSSDLAFDMEIKGVRGRVVKGRNYLDMDGTGTESSFDVFGSGAVEIRIYDDADSNGIYLPSEVIRSILTNPYGEYEAFVSEDVRHLAVRMMVEDFDSIVEFTTDTLLSFTVSPSNLDTVVASFGTLGPRSLCLLIADDQSNNDEYYIANRITGKNRFVATMSTDEIEALAIRVGMDSIWAFDDGQFGTVDILTGAFTPIGSGVGYGTGLINGSSAGHIFTDIDGLAYDGNNDILYGVERRTGSNDLLVAIDRSTGDLIQNFFPGAREFVEIQGPGIKVDIDDIAFNPHNGQLLAVNNQNSGDSTRYISIDPSTGNSVVISIAGVGDFEGLGYYNTGELYGTTGEDNKPGYQGNSFYRIDRHTGVGTNLDTLYSGANDTEACDCLTGPIENLVSGTVFFDADSSGTYDKAIDSTFGNIKVYLYKDVNNDGVIDELDELVDSTFTDNNTGFYVFIVDTIGQFLSTPYIEFTALELMNVTTDSSVTEDAEFVMLGDFDGQNDFGFHNTSGVPYLPVEWLDVAAEWTENKNAAITWSTASESNNSHFEVERLNEKNEYEYIGTVEAVGNSTSVSEYSFVDFEADNTPTNTVIYRIKQIDFDQKYDFSPSVALKKNDKTTATSLEMVAYPNPMKDALNIKIDAQGDYSIELLDASSNIIIQKTGQQHNSYSPIVLSELNALSRGMYILRVVCDGREKVVKLIK